MTTSLYARIHALPGHEDTVAGMLAKLAVAVRSEPGNLVFDPWRETGTEGSFFVYEVYADASAFAEHLAASYSVAFNAELAEHVTGTGSELTSLGSLA
ncbi:MAG: antibiotic biosynthesis monooxygenase [Actinobacteria bacterium HGW-Actinobacteria-8]|nr:MAG: antibiotic biosynthesis monooxygenase [Actinobacteria bacterium HGW-Actinobacteria-8]